MSNDITRQLADKLDYMQKQFAYAVEFTRKYHPTTKYVVWPEHIPLDVCENWSKLMADAAFAYRSQQAAPAAEPTEVERWKVKTEKLLCEKLGRDWSPEVSIAGLIDELQPPSGELPPSEREAFEEHMANEGHEDVPRISSVGSPCAGEYANSFWQSKWETWQARAAIASKQAVPMTDEQREVLSFLLGVGVIDGRSFGDIHPETGGRYWWRADLRKAFPTFVEAFHNIKD